eukprot:jgi/Pico_ML_1/54633/g524.t1
MQALFDLEATNNELKADLRDLFINSAKEAAQPPLTAVHDAILDDLVYPTEIVGKRLRYKWTGPRSSRCISTQGPQHPEYKLDTFSSVYQKLTGKHVVFEFPLQD